MKITLHRDDFKDVKDYVNGKYQSVNLFDEMLKSQFNIKNTEDVYIDSIEVDVDIDTIYITKEI